MGERLRATARLHSAPSDVFSDYSLIMVALLIFDNLSVTESTVYYKLYPAGRGHLYVYERQCSRDFILVQSSVKYSQFLIL